MNKIYYHVTTADNGKNISEKGLIPAIGPRSKTMGETKPAIWLFESKEEMETSLENWLGETLDDGQILIIKAEIPIEFASRHINPNSNIAAGYECACTAVIPPEMLTFYDENQHQINADE